LHLSLGNDLIFNQRQQLFKRGEDVGLEPACNEQEHYIVTDLQISGVDPDLYLYNPGSLLENMESGICDFCGEATKMDLLRKIDGKRVCIPCAERHRLGDR